MANPEQAARAQIDRLLAAAGWAVQDFRSADLAAARGVALREFELNPGHGTADYLLYADGRACGVIEAKKLGATLSVKAWWRPLRHRFRRLPSNGTSSPGWIAAYPSFARLRLNSTRT